MPLARKILVLAYALFYAWLAVEVERTNVKVGYHVLYVAVSTLAQIVLELVVEVVMDAFLPNEFNLATHGAVWVLSLVLSLALAAPAYYFNWKVARG
jgi:hypothetical protein